MGNPFGFFKRKMQIIQNNYFVDFLLLIGQRIYSEWHHNYYKFLLHRIYKLMHQFLENN